MSFEEPKAPIVRIRKKKVKKKTKEKDIVHLPVRASTQARYSSLPGAQDPQSKGRECCRHLFASCFKIPVCKTLCFRCILPSCYKDIDSDEEDGKDEGYHSQNRGSTEVPASTVSATQGASGSSENAVEMTEIKTETVALIPPPRKINEYRKDPCSREASTSSVESKSNQKTSEITYIEVESVPVTKENKLEASGGIEENIPDESKTDEAIEKESHENKSETEKETKESSGGYEVPIELRDMVVITSDSLEKNKSSNFDNEIEKTDIELDSSEYVECDNKPEKQQQYANMNIVLMPETEQVVKSSFHDYINDKEISESEKETKEGSVAVNYANLDSVNKDVNPSKDSTVETEEFDFTASEEPHDYMNLSELEQTKASTKEPGLFTTDIGNLVKVTKSEKTTVVKDTKLETNSLTNKQSSEVSKSELNERGSIEVENQKESEKNSISEGKPATADMSTGDQNTSKHSNKDCKFESLAVKESTETDSDHDNGKDYLVHVADSEKLVAKQSKKTKDIDRSSDESEDDSDGKKVTDQTKLI